MNKTLLKVNACLHWMEDNITPDMEIRVNNDTTITYYDIDDNFCVLNFDGEAILFEGKVLYFEDFINLLTGEDEYLIETMLGEINLDI